MAGTQPDAASPADAFARDVLTRRFHWSGVLLGFGLGGFFDGILLHQILQWHHLLSALEGKAFRDIRVQILADGFFHALMYGIAVLGLWLLWRTRGESAARTAGRMLLANAMIGFAAWHIADTIFSHWITGIHRIRMDSPNPLLWDILWLVLFGLGPLAAGLLLRRGGGPGPRLPGALAALGLGVAVIGAGAASSLPPPGVPEVMVYFRPGTSAAAVFAAADAVDGHIIWSDPSGQLWAFSLAEPSRAASLYRHGALFVGNSLFPAGCLSWSRAL